MARDADAARMGDAHAVEEEDVRLGFQLLECLFENRALAKAQETRNIGKGGRALRQHCLHRQEARIGDHDDSRLRLLVLYAHVDASHKLHRIEIDGAVGHDLRSQSLLKGDGLGGGEVPGMLMVKLHGEALKTTRLQRSRFRNDPF
jgi:hypothetical protein